VSKMEHHSLVLISICAISHNLHTDNVWAQHGLCILTECTLLLFWFWH